LAEVGEGRVAEHTALGGYVSTRGVGEAVLVVVGAELDALADAARAEGVTVYRAADTDAAVTHLATLLHPGDVVLVKASYSDGLWRVADGLHDKETK
jgi:UDP-N-acetylmuramoyl-tripeptide--D-alanyl-D-alanine ligase